MSSTNHNIVKTTKAIRLGRAEQFATELKSIGAPKKTVLISLMKSFGLNLGVARHVYKSAGYVCRKRHGSKASGQHVICEQAASIEPFSVKQAVA